MQKVIAPIVDIVVFIVNCLHLLYTRNVFLLLPHTTFIATHLHLFFRANFSSEDITIGGICLGNLQ